MTVPLWTLPIPVIVLAVADWLREKFGAGRRHSPPREKLTATTGQTAGADTPPKPPRPAYPSVEEPRVRVLAHSKPFDQDAA